MTDVSDTLLYTGEDRRQTIVAPPNNTKYMFAVLFMMALGVIAIAAIVISRPDNKDNLTVIGTIIGFLAPTTLSLLAFMKSQETHLSVNSRLDAFVAQARLASRAQGISEGRREGSEAANRRTDELAAGLISGSIPIVVNPLVNIEKNTKDAADSLKEIKEHDK